MSHPTANFTVTWSGQLGSADVFVYGRPIGAIVRHRPRHHAGGFTLV